jgi:hypothetical protein
MDTPPTRHAPFPVWPLSKKSGSGARGRAFLIFYVARHARTPPVLFSTVVPRGDSRLPLSPGHVNPPPEAPVPPHQTTVMIGVPAGSDWQQLWISGGRRGERQEKKILKCRRPAASGGLQARSCPRFGRSRTPRGRHPRACPEDLLRLPALEISFLLDESGSNCTTRSRSSRSRRMYALNAASRLDYVAKVYMFYEISTEYPTASPKVNSCF